MQDRFGQEIKEGAVITYPTNSYSMLGMKEAYVIGIDEDKEKIKVEVVGDTFHYDPKNGTGENYHTWHMKKQTLNKATIERVTVIPFLDRSYFDREIAKEYQKGIAHYRKNGWPIPPAWEPYLT